MDRSLRAIPTSSGEAARPPRPKVDDDTPFPFEPLPHLGPHPDCVLVVEDDPAVRHVVEQFLRADGWEVLTADSAAAGESAFARNRDRIGLVLTDIVMPGENGFWLARRVRGLCPRTPIIGMSGFVDADTQPAEHFDRFLEKPFTPTELISLVRAAFRRPVA